MARIRSIKPELLEDERTARLTHVEWRLFVSLLLLADDYGNLRAATERIHGAALWAHPREDLAKVLDGLVLAGLVVLYVVAGQRYAHISGWNKHQKVDHPGKPLCPALSEGSRITRETVANVPETLAPDQDQDHDLGSGNSLSPSRGSDSGQIARSNGEAKKWTARKWLSLFGKRWISVYGGLAYGGGDTTAKAVAQLEDILAALPASDADAAQARAATMLDEFFADASPKIVSARHPFVFFVTSFTGLRVPRLRVEPPPGGRSRADGNIDALAAWGKRKESAG